MLFSGVEFDFVAYAGDGSNDFSAMARLDRSRGDLALPRIGSQYSISSLINKTRKRKLETGSEAKIITVECDKLFWNDGHDIELIIQRRTSLKRNRGILATK